MDCEASNKAVDKSDKRFRLPKIALLDWKVRQCLLATVDRGWRSSRKIVPWSVRYNVQHVRDIGECELVEYFLEPMQLKKIPELKQRVYVVAEFPIC